MKRALLIALALLVASPATASRERATELADPKPSVDAPRRIVVSLAESDPARANAVFSNVINIQEFYGPDRVELAIVLYGPGVRHVLKGDSQVAERVASLRAYDITFIACGNTLESMGRPHDDLLDGVEVVKNGLPEIVEKVLSGWVHLKP